MKLLPNREVALKVRDPNIITTLIPHARRIDGHIVIVPHGVEETKILRNLGVQVPAPMPTHYNWPGHFIPFAHQIESSSFMSMNHRCFVLLDMGLGKSMSALWAADYLMREKLIRKVLVLSTLSSLDLTWEREIFRNMMHRHSIVVHGTKRQRIAALQEDVDFYIMNHHGLLVVGLELITLREDIDLIILDEGAMLRNSRTQIYKRFKAILRTDQRLWILTGKPCPNGPEDAWALAKLVSPSRVPAFFTRWKDMTMRKVSMFKWVPRQGSDKLMFDAMQPAIRYKKADCLDLPPVTFSDRQVEISPMQQQYYKFMKSQLVIYAQQHQITAVNAAVLMGKLLQICCGAVKTDAGEYIDLDPSPRLAVLDECFEEAAAKVLVFVPYTGALRAVTTHLRKRWNVLQVDGSTSRTQRGILFNQFKDDLTVDGIVVHPKVAAHSLNFTEADMSVWFSPIHSLDTYDQANERMARPGQTRNMNIIHLGGCPLEWGAYRVLSTRGSAQEAFLDLFKQELQLA
jgi:SNF2 family DNA or RNA helicase